jgi:hypothetical protein
VDDKRELSDDHVLDVNNNDYFNDNNNFNNTDNSTEDMDVEIYSFLLKS